jgi:DNA helicase-2/ATP-dependent DNA helicase PcrA
MEYKCLRKKVVATLADIGRVTNPSETLWQKNKNKEFYTGCDKNECHWCNFVKTNKISIGLHELNEDQVESEISLCLRFQYKRC